jgi:U2-associated protein SR140
MSAKYSTSDLSAYKAALAAQIQLQHQLSEPQRVQLTVDEARQNSFQRGSAILKENKLELQQRARILKEQQLERESAEIYEEFAKSFQSSVLPERPIGFVSGGIINSQGNSLPPKANQPKLPKLPGGMKRPAPGSINPAKNSAAVENLGGGEADKGVKKPRNIDSFLEEMKARQSGVLSQEDRAAHGRAATDPLTTNLHIGNLPMDITVDELYSHFSIYGDISSCKVFEARTAEEFARGKLSGFVCFMWRADAELAWKLEENTVFYAKTAEKTAFTIKIAWFFTLPFHCEILC